ncbi:MAG: DUF3786 domain-containing protein [Syntrophobacteraceae bacterium]
MKEPETTSGKKDERREKLDRRLTPIHLYKLTPKNNCGQCGFASCLAFSTQVIVGQADITSCEYIDAGEQQLFESRLAAQLQEGIGAQREGFEQALQFLRQEILACDLQIVAPGLGGEYFESDGKAALRLTYLGKEVIVTAAGIDETNSDAALSPYEKIVIYNYVTRGATEPAGVWVGMESLPNSVSKVKSLRSHCRQPLARASAGNIGLLPSAIAGLGKEVPSSGEKADFAAEFQILPKLSIRILWWDEDEQEGFRAATKFLFDSRVLSVLDLESLLFACQLITDRLLERLQGT